MACCEARGPIAAVGKPQRSAAGWDLIARRGPRAVHPPFYSHRPGRDDKGRRLVVA